MSGEWVYLGKILIWIVGVFVVVIEGEIFSGRGGFLEGGVGVFFYFGGFFIYRNEFIF